jgi:sialidase-1
MKATDFHSMKTVIKILLLMIWPAVLSGQTGLRKISDIVIYEDSSFYSAFPSAIRMANGELIVAFRRAPDRRSFGEKGNNHVDPNSYLVMVRSSDKGKTWSKDPQLIHAHPFGGSQDPCLLRLLDGTLLCTSYVWAFLRPDGMEALKKPFHQNSGATFLGGYYLRSSDNGQSWEGPFYPPHIKPEINFSALGEPLPAYNRGALCESADGRIFWAVAANDRSPRKSSVHLLTSDNKGLDWTYSCPIAVDDSVTFNETSLFETPAGNIVAFLRTANFGDQACIARSTDGGRSFGRWESIGFMGHPLTALKLPDNRVLLVYGYRHQPYGIRARILNAECKDFKTAHEYILRDDGGSTDLGYPWPVMIDDNNALVVYYFNKNNGTRHIAGTIIKLEDN